MATVVYSFIASFTHSLHMASVRSLAVVVALALAQRYPIFGATTGQTWLSTCISKRKSTRLSLVVSLCSNAFAFSACPFFFFLSFFLSFFFFAVASGLEAPEKQRAAEAFEARDAQSERTMVGDTLVGN